MVRSDFETSAYFCYHNARDQTAKWIFRHSILNQFRYTRDIYDLRSYKNEWKPSLQL